MQTTLRDAAEADLPAILAIANQAILETTATFSIEPVTLASRRSWLLERRRAGLPVLVVEAGGGVAGFGSYGPFRPWDGYLHSVEHSLYVDPACHRRGLGTALLAGLVEHARRAGMHAIVGGIDAGNLGSIALHRHLGFVETGRLPEVARKFDRWLDLVLMQKML